MFQRALGIACVAGVACAVAPADGPDAAVDREPPSVIGAADSDDICELLPTCGPCSLACDPVELAEQYVPVGTCASFLCTLLDGREIQPHACHYAEP